MQTKNLGAPIANESVHSLMRARRLTTLEFDTEMAAIENEPGVPLVPGFGGGEESEEISLNGRTVN